MPGNEGKGELWESRVGEKTWDGEALGEVALKLSC